MSHDKPMLRPVEAIPTGDTDGHPIAMRDRTGLSPVILGMSEPALFLVSLMDGSRTHAQICTEFLLQVGQPVALETIETLVRHLDEAHLLEGPRFESFYEGLASEYRANPTRAMHAAVECGIDDAGAVFGRMLDGVAVPEASAPAVGLIAPHVDYLRGEPCYAAAYGQLVNRPAPDRVIILGTNHFGRSQSAVATDKSFATPLGVTPCDRGFLERLEDRCGGLREFEMDHAREHSIELQVAWLQYLFGAESFSIVPILCPDPCGPTGTAPYNGKGVDLRDLASAIRDLISDDEADTLIIAGADFSHVGVGFGDDRPLDDVFLAHVRNRDQAALAALTADDAAGMVACLSADENSTRVCSAGCVFVARETLRGCRARLLQYHQAVHSESQTCVTCAAVLFT